MFCDNEIVDLMDIEIIIFIVIGCFMFYKKCFNIWNILYLGFFESKERGFFGLELGIFLIFFVFVLVRGFRWNVSLIFFIWINCFFFLCFVMNLKEKRVKVRVKLMLMF